MYVGNCFRNFPKKDNTHCCVLYRVLYSKYISLSVCYSRVRIILQCNKEREILLKLFQLFRRWCLSLPVTLKVNRRRKSYVRNMQNRTDLSIGVRQYGVGLFIFSLSTHLPGAVLPPETGVVSALTLTAVPVSGCLWSRSKFPPRYPVVEEALLRFSRYDDYVNNIIMRILKQVHANFKMFTYFE